MDIATLKDLLVYDPETGVLVWKERALSMCKTEGHRTRWNGQYANKPAGTTCKHSGYVILDVFAQPHRAHRVIFALMTGDWPKGQIDHINGNRADNRWANLRDVSKKENGKNQKRSMLNKSGVTGVFWEARARKWRVKINDDKKIHWLGYFHDLEDAVAARKAAEIKFGYHENHGRAA